MTQKMTQNLAGIAVAGAFAIAAAGQATAQEFYGGASLGVGYFAQHAFGAADDGTATTLEGFIGTGLGSGFVEGDLRYTWQDARDSGIMEDGGVIALRYGMPIGAYTAEVVAGLASLAHENDDFSVERYFVAFGASRAVNDALTVQGQIGFLDGSQDYGGDPEDPLHKAVFAGVGLDYQVNDRLSLGADFFVAGGGVDQESENYELYELVLGAEYDLGVPGLSAFGEFVYGDHYQYGENDKNIEQRITLGVSYEFGGNPDRSRSSRLALPRYEQWLNISGGILE